VLRFQTIPTPSHSRKHRNPQFEKIVSKFDMTNKRVFNVAGRMLQPDSCAFTDKGFVVLATVTNILNIIFCLIKI